MKIIQSVTIVSKFSESEILKSKTVVYTRKNSAFKAVLL